MTFDIIRKVIGLLLPFGIVLGIYTEIGNRNILGLAMINPEYYNRD
jgi:hypothetical protein